MKDEDGLELRPQPKSNDYRICQCCDNERELREKCSILRENHAASCKFIKICKCLGNCTLYDNYCPHKPNILKTDFLKNK